MQRYSLIADPQQAEELAERVRRGGKVLPYGLWCPEEDVDKLLAYFARYEARKAKLARGERAMEEILDRLPALSDDELLKVSLAAQLVRSYRAAKQELRASVVGDPTTFEPSVLLMPDLGGEG